MQNFFTRVNILLSKEFSNFAVSYYSQTIIMTFFSQKNLKALILLSIITLSSPFSHSNELGGTYQPTEQTSSAQKNVSHDTLYNNASNLSTRNFFNHLEAGINVGSTGLGVNVATNIGNHVRVRAGIDFTPHFSVPMSFSLQSYTEEGGINSGNFEKMQRYMKKLTGFEVDDKVEIDGKPTMTNFKFLVDVYPWANKGWRVTAGFYAGSKKIAKAVNTIGEMPSLLAVNIYNHFYDYIMSDDAIDKPIFGNTWLDPFMIDEIRNELAGEGYMGIHIGDYLNGAPYMLQPDSDGMVKVNAFVNRFKPYAGLGYTGELDKNKRWKLDVDCGVMMWGGTPSLIAHDGVNLSKDVKNIKGKPGDYVDVLKTFKVYPVISVAVSYKFF